MTRVTINFDAVQVTGLSEIEIGVRHNSIHTDLIVIGEANMNLVVLEVGVMLGVGAQDVWRQKLHNGIWNWRSTPGRIWKWRYVKLAIKERISWNIQYYSIEHVLIYSGLIKRTSSFVGRSSNVFQ